ncbi:hypothetical protein MIR68_008785 [Amoeboaphelidium protococcarum]|nr:hypothetical protein MIR68_008785 [Amoeboaphelidium protococcarum]
MIRIVCLINRSEIIIDSRTPSFGLLHHQAVAGVYVFQMFTLINSLDRRPSTSTQQRLEYKQQNGNGKESERRKVIETAKIHEVGMDDLESNDRLVNQYLLQEVLGEGSYSVVYKAIDTNSNQVFAVKEISKSKVRRRNRTLRRSHNHQSQPSHSSSIASNISAEDCIVDQNQVNHNNHKSVSLDRNDPLMCIYTEIEILKRSNHPNIVQLYEVLNDPDQDCLYIVFEYCSGGHTMKMSMEERQTPLSEDRCRQYFSQLLYGVEYLHGMNIVHRDLKPDNLLISNNNGDLLKISDFGVSVILDDATLTPEGQLTRIKSAGSPAFMAPELIDHQQHFRDHDDAGVDYKKADIWAMGVTLYCWLTGSVPFQGETLFELNKNILKTDVQILLNSRSDIPESAKDILIQMLQKDSSARASIDQLKANPWVLTLVQVAQSSNSIAAGDNQTKTPKLKWFQKVVNVFRRS